MTYHNSKLNIITSSDKHPIPNIDDILDGYRAIEIDHTQETIFEYNGLNYQYEESKPLNELKLNKHCTFKNNCKLINNNVIELDIILSIIEIEETILIKNARSIELNQTCDKYVIYLNNYNNSQFVSNLASVGHIRTRNNTNDAGAASDNTIMSNNNNNKNKKQKPNDVDENYYSILQSIFANSDNDDMQSETCANCKENHRSSDPSFPHRLAYVQLINENQGNSRQSSVIQKSKQFMGNYNQLFPPIFGVNATGSGNTTNTPWHSFNHNRNFSNLNNSVKYSYNNNTNNCHLMKRNASFDNHRKKVIMAQEQQLVKEIETKNQQIIQLTAAVQHYQEREAANIAKEKIMREVRFMSTFTGKGEVTINSFISSIEYYLSSVQDAELKKLMVRTIYFEKIQGEAKDAIISIPEPDNWELIKSALRLRYKPDIEPAEIYRRINNIKCNSVEPMDIGNIETKNNDRRYRELGHSSRDPGKDSHQQAPRIKPDSDITECYFKDQSNNIDFFLN
ncbi:putative uncharacterized protein DDB_G0282499 [Condylostylus longicornis]|uniref:putative uncharacterized protein DDB_G0282499 n=1 Tax=Condylostylus longicornis TaxID=2530218 RepID=UPI00244DF7E8|nr:putative uncharacterized protein DDB_G0282499 [Condylostylus longicornis]